MGKIRTLVLSGGGGRGAFHAGVYRYLSQAVKPGVDAGHQQPWVPDIVVGTSIGAVNGAAIVQGMPAEELVQIWLSLREEDIEGLPPGMSRLARWGVNLAMRQMLGTGLPTVSKNESTSPQLESAWELLPGMPKWLTGLLGRWSSLLDTGPLRRTLTQKMKFDAQKVQSSRQLLLINATNVSTGRRTTFSSRPLTNPRRDVIAGINIQRILASCSIPMVYPWTVDPQTHATYWDGAVVNNTPIGVAVDAAREFSDTDAMEMVVVMMTPWREPAEGGQPIEQPLPHNFSEAITWALDWALLASFRERLDLIEAYNRLRRLGRQVGDPELSRYREIEVTIAAPENFIPAARILDYDRWNEHLIAEGYKAAEQAFRIDFPEKVGKDAKSGV